MHFTNVFLSLTALTALASVAYGIPAQLAANLCPRAVNMSGRMTFFEPNGVGACGETSTSDQSIVALSASLFDSSKCGSTITIQANGKSATATVVDRCAACGTSDIDVSTAVFDIFASEDAGSVNVEWGFN